jgi:hypothetical protein
MAAPSGISGSAFCTVNRSNSSFCCYFSIFFNFLTARIFPTLLLGHPMGNRILPGTASPLREWQAHFRVPNVRLQTIDPVAMTARWSGGQRLVLNLSEIDGDAHLSIIAGPSRQPQMTREPSSLRAGTQPVTQLGLCQALNTHRPQPAWDSPVHLASIPYSEKRPILMYFPGQRGASCGPVTSKAQHRKSHIFSLGAPCLFLKQMFEFQPSV